MWCGVGLIVLFVCMFGDVDEVVMEVNICSKFYWYLNLRLLMWVEDDSMFSDVLL